MRGKIVRIIRACELSEHILHCAHKNGRELCPEQACELSGACELARVKLSALYCISMWGNFTELIQSTPLNVNTGKVNTPSYVSPSPGHKVKDKD